MEISYRKSAMEYPSVTKASFFRTLCTWRSIALACVVILVWFLLYGRYPRHFEFEWDEEVQLTDGRTAVVHVRHTFERIHRTFDRYGGAIGRDTELSFDAGGSTGRITQLFKGHAPLMLDQERGQWYLMIFGAPYYKSQLIPGQNFGPAWYGCGQVLRLQGDKFVPISIHDLPAAFKQPNFLRLIGPLSEHARSDHTLLTVAQKREWRRTHPVRNHEEGGICRPPKNTVKPLDLFHYNPVQRETR